MAVSSEVLYFHPLKYIFIADDPSDNSNSGALLRIRVSALASLLALSSYPAARIPRKETRDKLLGRNREGLAGGRAFSAWKRVWRNVHTAACAFHTRLIKLPSPPTYAVIDALVARVIKCVTSAALTAREGRKQSIGWCVSTRADRTLITACIGGIGLVTKPRREASGILDDEHQQTRYAQFTSKTQDTRILAA